METLWYVGEPLDDEEKTMVLAFIDWIRDRDSDDGEGTVR